MFRSRADDKTLAQNAWAICCARCGHLHRHSVHAVVGRCEGCGHTFSEMRLLTRQEARMFLKGKLEATIQWDKGNTRWNVFNGIEDVPDAFMERYRNALSLMERQQAERMARRRQGRIREEKYVIPRVGMFLRRFERKIHDWKEGLRHARARVRHSRTGWTPTRD